MQRALLLVLALISGAAIAGEFRRVAEPVRGQYVVAFTSEVARTEIDSTALELTDNYGGRLLYTYSDALPGFAIG